MKKIDFYYLLIESLLAIALVAGFIAICWYLMGGEIIIFFKS